MACRSTVEVTYTADGAKGVLKDGGTKRKQAATKLIESVGGTLDEMYFAFGHADVIAIADMPDSAASQRPRSPSAPAARRRAGRPS